MQQSSLILIAAVIAIIFVIAMTVRMLRTTAKFSPYKKRRLLTNPEVVMFSKIQRAVRGLELAVGFQVSMGALIDLKRTVEQRRRLGLRSKFDRKIVDFVLMDRDGYAVLLIELDDLTHSFSKDAARDALTRSAGYRTLRYRNVRGLSVEKLRADIMSELKIAKEERY